MLEGGGKALKISEVSLRLVLLAHLKYLSFFSPEYCNNQKLLLEYEKYQELQLKSQRMQEEYEKQLRDNDETKSQALEELTEFYEAKLQEKTTLLEEVLTGSQAVPPFHGAILQTWPVKSPKSCGKPCLTSCSFPSLLSVCMSSGLNFTHLFPCRAQDSQS